MVMLMLMIDIPGLLPRRGRVLAGGLTTMFTAYLNGGTLCLWRKVSILLSFTLNKKIDR